MHACGRRSESESKLFAKSQSTWLACARASLLHKNHIKLSIVSDFSVRSPLEGSHIFEIQFIFFSERTHTIELCIEIDSDIALALSLFYYFRSSTSSPSSAMKVETTFLCDYSIAVEKNVMSKGAKKVK